MHVRCKHASRSFFYCGAKHKKLHWRGDHSNECSRMAQQMARGLALAMELPFFCAIPIEISSGLVPICSLLQTKEIHNQGIYKAVCDCSYNDGGTMGTLESAKWLPPTAGAPLQGSSLRSWQEYCTWRSLPVSHPDLLVLHWVLTIYQAYQLATSSGPLRKSIMEGSPLRIHYLGPERELDQVAVFAELAWLLPVPQIEVCFIGPRVPATRDGGSVELSIRNADEGLDVTSSPRHAGVRVKFFKGLYHEVVSERAQQVGPADLVIAPNAGLAAYTTWQPTIALLNSPGSPPAFFTDYCEEATCLAAQVLTSCGARLTHEVQPNPFRQPWRIRARDNALPSFSNGFLVGIN
ncbi:hypothetical protein KFL_000270300 [Klebsormidium nitens]|uniref:Mitochondrial splicing suppressor 51-like C-terminal domain-containing protein n=1 Tax=Klebsormidium nitens TaxID=105231 RepID=A0A1Y1HQK5_KLENI|nr:hypothetical protein KFL_000270300 [Klebsormidium nitens]|eukprot:GAQ79271.1 hypothetical protein KFL_000270300 [Klebsormidium nitens]